MALLTYTTYDEIRAVLGVSKTELADATLALPIYDPLASIFLDEVNPNLETRFSEVSALPSKTLAQQRFLDLVKLFVNYKIARELLTSLPMFSVKALSDGRAEFQRQDGVFDDLKDGIDSAVTSMKYRLTASFAQLYPSEQIPVTYVRPSITSSVGLAIDPVTNA